MGWDETLFGFILKTFSSRRPNARDSARARLETEESVLRILAGALSGEALKISAAEDVGGYDGSHLFLPSEIDLFELAEDNRKAYLYRVAATVMARKMGLTLPNPNIGRAQERRLSLEAIPALRLRIAEDLPRAGELLLELGRALAPKFAGSETAALADPDVQLLLFGRLMPSSAPGESSMPSSDVFSPESLSSGTEKKGKPRERAEVVLLGEEKDDENPLVHVFEKVLTADEYGAGKKNLDGSDELEDHEEALQELNLRHVIRSREKTRSIYKSDVMVDGGAPDLEDGAPMTAARFRYDEWDHSKRSYRRDWCTVSASTAPSAPQRAADLPHPQPAAVKKLRSELEKIMNERRWRGRQLDGPEPDLDSLVTAAADRRSGVTPSNRVYLSRRRAHRDFAATILIDMSLSTDSWVDNRHVIQIARESVLALSDVFDGIAENVSVAAFSSNTRRDCRYLTLKTFDESWTKLRARIPALTPTGYTRIGPAIRHATAELNRTDAKKKLLLLISDGKPTDYDRYEGTYGIEDVRQAIKEAQGRGLRVRSLAIDAEAKNYLPRIFGPGGYQILSHPGLLATALSKIFAQCLA